MGQRFVSTFAEIAPLSQQTGVHGFAGLVIPGEIWPSLASRGRLTRFLFIGENMSRLRVLLPLLFLVALSACAKSVWAPNDAVVRAAYISNDPPSISLVTVINNRTGAGGHTALVINAEQRVVFDPAGNFKYALAPERNDFLYGMTPPVLRAYYGFHARKAWHVVIQKVLVSPEVAEKVYQLAKNYGAVASGFCAESVTTILKKVPGFKSIPVSFSPVRTMKRFAKIPGVVTRTIYEDD